MERLTILVGLFVCFASLIYHTESTCVLESDFGFTINCAFKKSGLFRVRNLGGIKAHVGLGFSVGDELGFGQSLTNLDPSRRRSVSVRNGLPPNAIGGPTVNSPRPEKRSKQNRIMVRQPSPSLSENPPPQMNFAVDNANLAAVKAAMANLQRRVYASTTMQPIIVPSAPAMEQSRRSEQIPKITIAKPLPMNVPPFRPLPPKDNAHLNVLPISATKRTAQIPQAKGPGLAYASENQMHRISHDQVSKMVSQMTASHMRAPPHRGSNVVQYTPAPIIVDNYQPHISHTTPHIPAFQALPDSKNQFIPMPVAATAVRVSGISVVPGPVFKDSTQIPIAHSMITKNPTALSFAPSTLAIRKQPAPQSYPSSNFVDTDPHGVNNLASQIYSQSPTKKLDDYNSISGYGEESSYKYSRDDLNMKITQIAQAGNISMEAVEAAILLRQQQLLNQYANIAIPTSSTTSTSTELPYQEGPNHQPVTPKHKRYPMAAGSAKVMNAPREYYPIGYEKNFDDKFESKVELPETSFYCGDQKYFPGLYGDENLGCMVFHVCALTDDGLVMKSFLCPESTLFDQTILKCNWWFYVDCKSSRQLYDTNIPVSKSYQLMKALTFFSSYTNENVEEGGRTQDPEDIEGIKEAIAILENQDSPRKRAQHTDNVEIITAAPIVSNPSILRTSSSKNNGTSNHRMDRENRQTSTKSSISTSLEDSNTSGSQHIQRVSNRAEPSKRVEVTSGSPGDSNSKERNDRRKKLYALRGSRTSTTKPIISTTTAVPTTAVVSRKFNPDEPKLELELTPVKSDTEIKIESSKRSNQGEVENATELKFEETPSDHKEVNITNNFRKAIDEVKESYKPAKELSMINNEKVEIVRPTPISELVGQYPTPTATIAALDQAILGTDSNKIPEMRMAQPTAATLTASYTIGNSTPQEERT